ncbi:glycosyltransferase [Magnetococcus sp. PR-3]|uniref:glycosyltransferase n=1 Tax=Magnetococcus sp. PR-3 TaxID=3120355 RepID=UPI002FCE1D65
MGAPLFTIVIPTRNRLDCVKGAIRAACAQEYPGVEILVSDNSDAAVAQSLEQFCAEPDQQQVRYIRPEKILAMTDHWEWAVAQAQGTYVGIVTDRMALKPHACTRLAEVVQTHTPPWVTYMWDNHGGDDIPFPLMRRGYSGQVIRLDNQMLLDQSAHSRFTHALPRFLNGFCHQDLLAKWRQDLGTIFGSISPDFNFTYRYLDRTDSTLLVDETLSISGCNAQGNGKGLEKGIQNAASKDFIKYMIGAPEIYQYAPIPNPVPFIYYNAILVEYESYRVLTGSHKFRPYNPSSFYHGSLVRIAQCEKEGENHDAARKVLEQFRQAHNIDMQPPEQPKGQPWIFPTETKFADMDHCMAYAVENPIAPGRVPLWVNLQLDECGVEIL